MPVAEVRFVAMQRFLRAGFTGSLQVRPARQRAVKVRVGQQGLRRVRPSFEKVLLGAGKLKVMLADILEPALGAQVASGLVRRRDDERPTLAIERLDRLAAAFTQRDLFALHETDRIGPCTGLVRREVRSPLSAG